MSSEEIGQTLLEALVVFSPDEHGLAKIPIWICTPIVIDLSQSNFYVSSPTPSYRYLALR